MQGIALVFPPCRHRFARAYRRKYTGIQWPYLESIQFWKDRPHGLSGYSLPAANASALRNLETGTLACLGSVDLTTRPLRVYAGIVGDIRQS